jgi:hypothetical protein
MTMHDRPLSQADKARLLSLTALGRGVLRDRQEQAKRGERPVPHSAEMRKLLEHTAAGRSAVAARDAALREYEAR